MVCPVIDEEDWQEKVWQTNPTLGLQPDPKKFARAYLLDYATAFNNFMTRGSGKGMRYMTLVDFDSEASKECSKLKEDLANKRRRIL